MSRLQTYEQNKVHIMNYRVNNTEKWHASRNATNRRMYAWKKIQKTFFNILLDLNEIA